MKNGGDLTKDFGVVHYRSVEREVPREVKLQEWEGQVQEVGSNYFSARLVDLTAGEKEETEEAELPLDDLIESDRALVVPGAVFRWIIGYRYMYGQKERFTRVVIRRLPMWTEQEIRSADREAADLYDALSAARIAADKMRSDATDLTERGTILLVEDQEELRALNARRLKSGGYTVIEADGIEVLEELDRQSGRVVTALTTIAVSEKRNPDTLQRSRFRALRECAPCVVRKSWWKVQRQGALQHLLAFGVLFELTVQLSEIIKDLRVILPLRGGLLQQLHRLWVEPAAVV
jgi:CheY-like chemotaxis protein